MANLEADYSARAKAVESRAPTLFFAYVSCRTDAVGWKAHTTSTLIHEASIVVHSGDHDD
jgi:hypothetical protein